MAMASGGWRMAVPGVFFGVPGVCNGVQRPYNVVLVPACLGANWVRTCGVRFCGGRQGWRWVMVTGVSCAGLMEMYP